MAKKTTTVKTEKIDALFVKSKVREYIKNKECNTASAVLDGALLNGIITGMLDKAIARAMANGRKTVKDRDL